MALISCGGVLTFFKNVLSIVCLYNSQGNLTITILGYSQKKKSRINPLLDFVESINHIGSSEVFPPLQYFGIVWEG